MNKELTKELTDIKTHKRIMKFLEGETVTRKQAFSTIDEFDYLFEKGVNFEELEPYFKEQLSKNESYIWLFKELHMEIPGKVGLLHLLVSYFKAMEKYIKLSGFNVDFRYDFPFVLIEEYDYVNNKIIELEKVEEEYKKAIATYMHFEKEFISDGVKYVASIPKTHKELIMEGYNMHNCLVMRGPYVARGEMKVVFIRKEDNKPYIDVILDENDLIIWAITDHHETINFYKERIRLVHEWYKTTIKNVPELCMWNREGIR